MLSVYLYQLQYDDIKAFVTTTYRCISRGFAETVNENLVFTFQQQIGLAAKQNIPPFLVNVLVA